MRRPTFARLTTTAPALAPTASVLATTVLAASMLGGAPQVARAEARLVCTAEGTASGSYVCNETFFCEEVSDCPPYPPGGAACDAMLSMGDARVCRPLCGAIHPCASDGDCPVVLGQSGTCTELQRPPLGLEVFGICTYEAVRYCATVLTGPDVDRCHTTPDGQRTSSWLFGDCDGDGCPNGRDPDPCAATAASECGTVTLGEGACVAPVPPAPAGDAGSPELDAGPEDVDAGSPDDAGPGEVDAGVEEEDAGPSQVPPGVDFHGGGGCYCAAVGGASGGLAGTSSGPFGGLAALVVGLGSLLARRRVRSSAARSSRG